MLHSGRISWSFQLCLAQMNRIAFIHVSLCLIYVFALFFFIYFFCYIQAARQHTHCSFVCRYRLMQRRAEYICMSVCIHFICVIYLSFQYMYFAAPIAIVLFRVRIFHPKTNHSTHFSRTNFLRNLSTFANQMPNAKNKSIVDSSKHSTL